VNSHGVHPLCRVPGDVHPRQSTSQAPQRRDPTSSTAPGEGDRAALWWREFCSLGRASDDGQDQQPMAQPKSLGYAMAKYTLYKCTSQPSASQVSQEQENTSHKHERTEEKPA